MKKAKAFLVRKAVRKLKDASESAATGTEREAAELRLNLLKALPPGVLAHEALRNRGILVAPSKPSKAPPADGSSSVAEWEQLREQHTHVCASLVGALLANALVRQLLEAAPTLKPGHRLDTPTGSGETLAAEPSPHASDGRAADSKKRARPAGDIAADTAGSKSARAANTRVASLKASTATKGAAAVKKPPAREPAKGATSVFMSSLAGDSDGEEASGEEASDGETGALSMAAGGRAATGSKKKVKNVISKSGNRMGQRQRRALMDQAAGGSHPQSKGAGMGTGRGRGKGNAKAVGRGGRGAAHAGRGRGTSGSMRSASAGAGPPSHGAGASGGTLHPSWEAKKAVSAGIKPFQGKRVTFD